MAFNRPGITAHKENVNTVKSLYLKTSDFEIQRRLRPLPWIYQDQPIDVLPYQEGWYIPEDIDPKSKKLKFPNGKPVRFPADMKPEDFPTLDWKEESYAGSKPRKKTPSSAISLLVWDYTSHSIKIASFTQKAVLKPMNEYMSPTNEDGSVNETFIESLCSVDLIVKKIDDKTWNLTTKEGNPKIPLEAWKELGTLQFSWDNFMSGESDMEHAPVLADFIDQIEGEVEVETPDEQKKRIAKQEAAKAKSNPEAANKTISKEPGNKEPAKVNSPVKSSGSEAGDPDWWKSVQSSTGKKVIDMSLDYLNKTKVWFETDKKDTYQNSKLYAAVVAAIKDKTPPPPEPKEEAPPEDEGFIIGDEEETPFADE